MGRDRRRARSTLSISITQRRDVVVVVVVPSTAHNAASFVIFEGVARVYVMCEGVCLCVRVGRVCYYYFYDGTRRWNRKNGIE